MAFDNGDWKGMVRFVTELPPTEDGDEVYGTYEPPGDKNRAAIEIVGNGPRMKVLQRLFHELIHDCEEAQELSLDDQNEVDRIARYFARLFRNSPALARFVYESANPNRRK